MKMHPQQGERKGLMLYLVSHWATRTSVLLAFNNQHYNIQHHSTK